MQAGQLIPVRTDPATQFISALAQNAALTENLAMRFTQAGGNGYVDAGLAAGKTVKARLRSIFIQSVENLAWEVWLWGKHTFDASLTDPTNSYPLGFWSFAAADAKRIASAGLYHYYVEDMDTPYADLDNAGEIHLMLVNRSVSAKTAGSNGYILIQLNMEPTLGW